MQGRQRVSFSGAGDQKPPALQYSSVPASSAFVTGGAILLGLLCIVPLWNSAKLLESSNYVFWCGEATPGWLILACCSIIFLYCVTAGCAATRPGGREHGDGTIFAITNIFVTLLGMTLMFMSLPLSREAVETYDSLMHMCRFSPQTQRMYEYSQVLYNIRSTPECMTKYSVEECFGYEEAKPYTYMLKKMEKDFRCTGFCYQAPPALAAAAPGPAPAPVVVSAPAPAASMLEFTKSVLNHTSGLKLRSRARAQHQLMSEGLELAGPWAPFEAVDAHAQEAPTEYPPTLFSLGTDYQVSCEGMAARDIKIFVGDIGYQTFYQGVYLVFIAIITSMLKLVTLCTHKDRDAIAHPQHYSPPPAGSFNNVDAGRRSLGDTQYHSRMSGGRT